MKILRATFLGVPGLGDAAFDFENPATGAPHDVVIFGGPAASGKTRALEAIVAAKEVLAPYGTPQPWEGWAPPGGASKIALAFHLDDEEQAYAGEPSAVLEAEVTFRAEGPEREADEGLIAVLDRYSNAPEHGKLEYFPASRRIPILPPFHGLGIADQRRYRATKDPAKYGFITRFLSELEREPSWARQFSEHLRALSPTCRYVAGAPPGKVPRCLSSKGGAPASPSELSDGEADAVLFAATAVAIGLNRSLVLVDRPESHVGPGAAGRFFAALRALGEGNQLIVATSSPSSLAPAEPALVLEMQPPA